MDDGRKTALERQKGRNNMNDKYKLCKRKKNKKNKDMKERSARR